MKSPAIPVFPSWLRSRFDDGTGVNVMPWASDRKDAHASRHEVECCVQLRNEGRGHLEDIRIVARG